MEPRIQTPRSVQPCETRVATFGPTGLSTEEDALAVRAHDRHDNDRIEARKQFSIAAAALPLPPTFLGQSCATTTATEAAARMPVQQVARLTSECKLGRVVEAASARERSHVGVVLGRVRWWCWCAIGCKEPAAGLRVGTEENRHATVCEAELLVRCPDGCAIARHAPLLSVEMQEATLPCRSFNPLGIFKQRVVRPGKSSLSRECMPRVAVARRTQ